MSQPERDGTTGRQVSRREFLGWAAGLAVLGGCTGSKARGPARASKATRAPALTRMRIGYVAELTGPNGARGQFVTASIGAMQGYLQDQLGGAYDGVIPELVSADAPSTVADAEKAYRQLVGERVDAIVWAAPFGLGEHVADINGGGVPVISVLADLHSYASVFKANLVGSGVAGSMVFQTAVPDAFSLDLMLAYAAEDRTFTTTGLVYDSNAYPHVAAVFSDAVGRRGLTNQGVYSYDPTVSPVDLSSPLLSLKHAGCEALVVYGMAEHVSAIANQLLMLDAKYKDTPSTKAATFQPMVLGSRWGTGDASFARLSGDAAARGTITAAGLGSLVALPSLPIRTWLHAYQPAYNGGFLAGGEDGPADAVAKLLQAAAIAGSMRAGELVVALEQSEPVPFATSIPVAFAPNRHLSVSGDEVTLVTLDYPPEPFALGNEWQDILPRGYLGPTHLVDFTLLDNTKAHADVMADILAHRYGVSASDDYQGADPAKVAACRALH